MKFSMSELFRAALLAALLLAALAGFSSGSGEILISELLADNDNGIRDDDGERNDWIELHNPGTNSVNLRGWWLTDKLNKPDKWKLPEVIIAPGEYRVVWTSGKDRDNPLLPLHTDFSLSKNGEYLGLYKPDPVDGTPRLVDDYAPAFPPLPPDISYGVTRVGVVTNSIAVGAVARYTVLSAGQGDAFYFGTDYAAGHLGHDQPGGWNVSPDFDDSAWIAAETGIGYDTAGTFLVWVGSTPESNCQTVLRYQNTSLCFRQPFVVQDAQALLTLTLRMKYEDGFVAFVNGIEVGRANCSAAMAYNTKADTALDESIVDTWTEYPVPLDLIRDGTNILAIQGLNSSLASSDFLLLPEVKAVLSGDLSYGYYAEATPGAPNGIPVSGALIFDAAPSDPDIPRPTGDGASPPLTVTVKVIETLAPVHSVRVFARRMYDAEAAPLLMRDDGVAPDLIGGDGVYSASIDTAAVAPGAMLRWRFEAQDSDGRVTKLPAFTDPLNTAQYFGTVALDPSVATSQLTTLHWFVQSAPSSGPTWSAFRGSCYYLSNFYDNTGHQIHGQSTRGFPKKSYDFDFTDEKRFLWKQGERRVKDINLLSNYADKTKTRNTVAHWAGTQMGTPSHFCDPVRVHLNAAFYAVMDLMEDSDDRMLERNGLDPQGAFYKIYSTDLITNVQKKTRKDEGNQDLIDLANGLNAALPLAQRTTYAYDHVDIAALVNYIVARQITADSDHGHKNFLMYRDTNDTREWQPIVWDVDLSYGHMWTSTKYYFDDALYYKPPEIALNRGAGCPAYKVVYDNPEVRAMWARRMRTLMDRWMQPPGTSGGIFETKMLEIVAAVDPDPAHNSGWTDADLDTAKWGIDSRWDYRNDPRQEVDRLIAEYYPNRRGYLFNTGADRPSLYGTVIPAESQVNAAGMVVVSAIESVPAGQLLGEKYFVLKNTTDQAVDLSGWTVEGSVSHTLRPGTVIPAGSGLAADHYVGLLHVVKDARAFRARSSGPTGGQRRFVQGNFDGNLPSDGGTVTLRDESGMLIFTTNYVGALSPSQQSLRVTEISYHPADPTVAELAAYPWATDGDFEFVELRNTGAVSLNLTGAAFVKGIRFVFPAFQLAPGARVIVARNLTAFNLRYPSVPVPVLGPFSGALDNSSDRLVLIDAGGDTVLDFEYHDHWYPLTDGSGRSLVLRTESIAADQYGDLSRWNVSWNPLGSPGEGESKTAQSYQGWRYAKFTEAERADPVISGPYADPDSDGRVNWVEYALGSDPKRKSSGRPLFFEWLVFGAARYVGLSYIRARNAVDLTFRLVCSDDLAEGVWSPASLHLYYSSNVSGERESLNYRDNTWTAVPRRFYTLQLEYTGVE